MIRLGMTDKEIVEELKSIEDTLMSRLKEYGKHFEVQLKSKRYKHSEVLGVQDDVINGNRVLICFQKLVLTNQLSNLGVSKIVLTKDAGAFLSVRNESGDFVFLHFTNHAIVRMLERTGLTIDDFFVEEFVKKAATSHFLMKYDTYGEDDLTYIMSVGICFFIVSIDGNKIVVKTTLHRDKIHLNQVALYVDAKGCAEKFASKTYDEDVAILKGIGVKNTRDLIEAMGA